MKNNVNAKMANITLNTTHSMVILVRSRTTLETISRTSSVAFFFTLAVEAPV